MEASEGIGDRRLLDKVDRLRALQVQNLALPQMVVVGDQSAGKSSVLDSLTGFSFPRDVSLCTRHATEIMCRREDIKKIIIKITPAPDTPKEVSRKLEDFERTVTDLDAHNFASIFKEAAEVMGIKSDSNPSGPAFSKHVLRVEINSPEADHFTIIDVPGMFENETHGVTEKSDINLVKDMVKKYIKESRTIILAVAPCNIEIANQKIISLAKEVDPKGERTLGVLTKPDLAPEMAVKRVIVDMVKRKRNDPVLGYCIVRNRGADILHSTAEERDEAERSLFAEDPWRELPSDRLGVNALRTRVQRLLVDRTKTEFPKVVTDVSSRLKESKRQLESLGASRITPEEQRVYLGHVARKFDRFQNYGLDAYYKRDKFLSAHPELRLITRIRELNECFSKIIYQKGHDMTFAVYDESTGDGSAPLYDIAKDNSSDRGGLYDELTFRIPDVGEHTDLGEVLCDAYVCPLPRGDCIMDHIKSEHLGTRGYGIGTFNNELVRDIFKDQAKKWKPITLAHVSNAILIVHHFIVSILEESCPDEGIRTALWNRLLSDLQRRYQKAMDHAEFLLQVEFQGTSITHNPEYLHVFTEARESRKDEDVEDKSWDGKKGAAHPTRDGLEGDDDEEKLFKYIHDSLFAFYDIGRSRFVDVVCQQVIDHFLLHSSDGPLSFFSAEAVFKMTEEDLEAIAGEDSLDRDKRKSLTNEIDRLTKALKILGA